MIYVFMDYDEVEKVYEGPDLNLEALEAQFELQYWGVKPFVPVDNPCGITSWRDGPRGECNCEGKACRQAYNQAWCMWNRARHEKFRQMNTTGSAIAKEFGIWLFKHYDFKPIEFKTVQV